MAENVYLFEARNSKLSFQNYFLFYPSIYTRNLTLFLNVKLKINKNKNILFILFYSVLLSRQSRLIKVDKAQSHTISSALF